MILLSTAYLGSIRYHTKLLQTGGRVVIDLGEHYRKQSFRNRCEILGSNGVIPLTVPVHKTSGVKTPVRQVRIDHSKNWRHNHWNSIRSAYKNSPYFDHYADCFEPIYERRYDLLWELNRDLQHTVLELLEIEPEFTYSDVYIPADGSGAGSGGRDGGGWDGGGWDGSGADGGSRDGDGWDEESPGGGGAGEKIADWRDALSEKPRLKRPDPDFSPVPYYQLFPQGTGFRPNLSILDLLFNEGPGSLDVLRSSVACGCSGGRN